MKVTEPKEDRVTFINDAKDKEYEFETFVSSIHYMDDKRFGIYTEDIKEKISEDFESVWAVGWEVVVTEEGEIKTGKVEDVTPVDGGYIFDY